MENERETLYSISQQRTLTLIPHVTAALSALGSLTIISIVLRDRKAKLKRVYHRLQLAMSVMDLVVSINLALSALVVPKGTPGVWNARGNTTTCEISGFVNQFLTSIPLYTACLCLYYVLIMVFRVKEQTIANRLEPWMHMVAWFYPLVMGVAGLVLDNYNPVDVNVGWCMLDDYPPNCSQSDEVECIRGENVGWFAMASSFFPVLPAYLVVLVCMALVVWKVRQTERRLAERHHIENARVRKKKRTFTDTLVQAFLYIGTFFVTYASQGVVLLFTRDATDFSNREFFFVLSVLNKTLIPLTGFWNVLIYIRPRYMALRRRHQGAKTSDLLSRILNNSDIHSGPRNARHASLDQAAASAAPSSVRLSEESIANAESEAEPDIESQGDERVRLEEEMLEQQAIEKDDYVPELNCFREWQARRNVAQQPSEALDTSSHFGDGSAVATDADSVGVDPLDTNVTA